MRFGPKPGTASSTTCSRSRTRSLLPSSSNSRSNCSAPRRKCARPTQRRMRCTCRRCSSGGSLLPRRLRSPMICTGRCWRSIRTMRRRGLGCRRTSATRHRSACCQTKWASPRRTKRCRRRWRSIRTTHRHIPCSAMSQWRLTTTSPPQPSTSNAHWRSIRPISMCCKTPPRCCRTWAVSTSRWR